MINNISLHNVLNYAMSDLEKYKFVATICRIEKARAKLDERSNLLYSNRNKIHHRSRTFFSDKFNRALECLEDNYKHLITKEFLEKENNYWYEEFYSKTTYYKYRKKAVDEFLAYYLDKDHMII
ncbi:hypothetical protein NQV05_00640 [Mycoplasmopsis agalactiae]|uniref:MG284/MPN403 family protein n=1 Tax=Mycoplasmopsis agalactiae TaxID=2110 RepID=UPI00211B9F33|nr:hypothetical protein [Mycoplasmopsis agalactiae]UUM25650.1 hypothetical protein NQV05_00640 [Mycoplasmopsis agalactiae]